MTNPKGMLKDSTMVFIGKHWKDKEDFNFVKTSVKDIVFKYKKAIANGEFKSKEELLASIKQWLVGFLATIKDHSNDDYELRLYNCFAFGLINELSEELTIESK